MVNKVNSKILLLILPILIGLVVVSCQPRELSETLPKALEKENVQKSPSQLLGVRVAWVEIPARAPENKDVNLRWRVFVDEIASAPVAAMIFVSHTAVHYDTKSHPEKLGVEITPQASGYPELTQEYASGSFAFPKEFSTTVTVPEGSKNLFLRAHAIVDGKNYWTEEKNIQIVPKVTEVEINSVKEFAVEGDDNGLYPREIKVEKGDIIKITFVARCKGVYYGGLDFRGGPWGDTGKVKPGESTTVSFTATETFTFKSYWPSSNALKATGKVIVE